jgi:hypothetical protein
MIDDKQFVISKQPYNKPNWEQIDLLGGYILSYHKALNIVCNNSCNIILLGDAWQALPDKQDPSEQIAACKAVNLSSIIEMEKSWCGRYLLIAGSQIFMDTCGLLGVVYSSDIVSSSLKILCELSSVKITKPKIKRGIMPDFVPGFSGFGYTGIKRLLPSQIYDYINCQTQVRALLPDGILPMQSQEQRTQEFVDLFANSLKNMQKHFDNKPLWVALTGGRDSRTLLALMEKAGVDYQIYTFEQNNISDGDIAIPKTLADKLGKKSVYIKRNKSNYSKQSELDFAEHTAQIVVEQDKLSYAYGQYQQLLNQSGGEAVILRSAIWGCANNFYEKFYGDRTMSIDNIGDYFQLEKYNPVFKTAFEEWFDYANSDTQNQELEISNRFLWEIREGCWLSSIEQALDMIDGLTSIHPANCRLFLEMLLAYPKPTRIAKKHEEQITALACPQIKDVPYDYSIKKKSPASKARGILTKTGKAVWLIQNYGFSNTLDYFKNRH